MELYRYRNSENIQEFFVEAMELPIVYNRYGEYDPHGLMYVLAEDAERIRKNALERFYQEIPQPYEEVQPLVLRVHAGEVVKIHFSHSLKRNLSIHVQGLEYDVLKSDGAAVGYNPDTTVTKKAEYIWYAKKEGVYLFSDLGDSRGGQEGTNEHGLFGAVIVEPPKAVWRSPKSGEKIKSGLFADIYTPGKPAFREYAVFFHDEVKVVNKKGKRIDDSQKNQVSVINAISYRSEFMQHPKRLTEEFTDSGEHIAMRLEKYGEPDTHLLRAYVGDPLKIRLVHGGRKETQVVYLQNHSWRVEEKDSFAAITNSISVSPQKCETLSIVYGAGGKNGRSGDAGLHFCPYSHFRKEMRAFLQIYNQLQDGKNQRKDETGCVLLPLCDRKKPPKEYQTDLPDIDSYHTKAEKIVWQKQISKTINVFEIAIIEAPITYNSYGWQDSRGLILVLKEELKRRGGIKSYLQKVKEGSICVEPLVIRANVGDYIELRMTNLLPEIWGNLFQYKQTNMEENGVQLTKVETEVSEFSKSGWEPIIDVGKYETLVVRFWADTQRQTFFLQDYLPANFHQKHGALGCLFVEEAGATVHHIRTGEILDAGTQAVIRRADGSSFRETVLFVHDAEMQLKHKEKLEPKTVEVHDTIQGKAINYRAEPMRERLRNKDDPAYVFSSHVHGDPATPMIETYPGEELVIHLLDGGHGRPYYFNLNGISWRKKTVRSDSFYMKKTRTSQVVDIHITEAYQAGDYLYYLGEMDEVWMGLWGVIRVYDQYQSCLLPLCKDGSTDKAKEILPLPPCPGSSEMIRHYEIAAIQADLVYNEHGDHDPEGIVFVPYVDIEKIKAGGYRYKPLILRANVGEWVEVTLHNCLSHQVPYFAYPKVPFDCQHTPSMRVSLQPQFLKYDSVRDAGMNVGYNSYEQTVGAGEKKTYRWFADKEYGTCVLQSFGDVRNHRYHGLFGALIVEPAGAKWFENHTKKPGDFSEQAVITAPGQEPFREFVLFIQNGLRLLDSEGKLIQIEEEKIYNKERGKDTGEKAYNYRSEPFYHRLQWDGRPEKVFSSLIHGDPATPIFRAETGDRVIFRTLMPMDGTGKAGFMVHGHFCKEKWNVSCSEEIPTQETIHRGERCDVEVTGGASCPGDYLYRSGSLKWDVEAGMWGIFRISGKAPGSILHQFLTKVRRCFGKRK